MLRIILDWLGGGVVKQFTGPLLEAYQAKLAAQSDADKLEAERAITRIEAARDIAVVEAGRAWSATSVGRWLIVVPFGIYWCALWLVQIVNPWFGLSLIVVAVPVEWLDMAKILVPAIVIADAGALTAKSIARRS